MRDAPRLYVVGFCPERTSERLSEVLANAERIVVSESLRNLIFGIPGLESSKVEFYRKFSEAVELVRRNLEGGVCVAFLASGDPMFFGALRPLLKYFEGIPVEVVPAVSSLQLAFSRMALPWDDVAFFSLHGRRCGEEAVGDALSLLFRRKKVFLLTDERCGPKEVLEALRENGLTRVRVWVFERLGTPSERILCGTAESLSENSFGFPNCVYLELESSEDTPIFGLREEEVERAGYPVTKDEVRAVVVHKLRCREGDVVWDVGAGCGTVSCEVAALSPSVSVFAVEKNEERFRLLKKNVRRRGVFNVRCVLGEAPEALKELPRPNRVFVGGSGGRLKEIAREVASAMKEGILVIAATTVETLSEATEVLKEVGLFKEVVSVQVSRSRSLGGRTHLRAENPVFLVVGER